MSWCKKKKASNSRSPIFGKTRLNALFLSPLYEQLFWQPTHSTSACTREFIRHIVGQCGKSEVFLVVLKGHTGRRSEQPAVTQRVEMWSFGRRLQTVSPGRHSRRCARLFTHLFTWKVTEITRNLCDKWKKGVREAIHSAKWVWMSDYWFSKNAQKLSDTVPPPPPFALPILTWKVCVCVWGGGWWRTDGGGAVGPSDKHFWWITLAGCRAPGHWLQWERLYQMQQL